MSLFILDTDHLTLLRQAHAAVVTRAVLIPRDQIATTVITFEEQVSGWYTAVRKARDADKLARAYAGLLEVAQTSRVIRILPFSREAVTVYLDLKKQHPRLGKMDLAIAAIALHNNATLVTRNRQDFEPIAGLTLEDWSA
ncbi:MAG: type II toxin-antitoxin system VapC family toxin [Planctomycetaceae bacterium]|nr:type II toxin-antitoxin system VapC family toxin [Planctomycetaceae bacterium]